MYRAYLGTGSMNDRSEYTLRYIGVVGEMRAGDCQLGTIKATPGKLLTRASRRNVGHPGRGGGGSWAGNRSRGIQLRRRKEGSRLAKTGCVTVSRPRSLL